MDIPEEIKKQVEAKILELMKTAQSKMLTQNIREGAEFGYSLASKEIEELKEALKQYVNWNVEEAQRRGYWKDHQNSPLYKMGTKLLNNL